MMEDMRIIGRNVGSLPPGDFGEAMTSLHTFITSTLGQRVEGVDAPADLRDLREGVIIDLVSDLRERRDGVAREIDPRIADGLIRFEQLRQNTEVARLQRENQSLREVNARLLGAAPAAGEGLRVGDGGVSGGTAAAGVPGGSGSQAWRD